MKNFLTAILLISIVSIATDLQAETKSGHDPVVANSAFDYNLIGELYVILTPAWMQSYPARDFESLCNAIDQLSPLVKRINHLKPKVEDPHRLENFIQARKYLVDLIRKAREAKDLKDKETIFQIWPDLYKSFEETVFYSMTVRFPEYESFVIIIDMLVNKYQSTGNIEAIIKAMSSLLIRNELLQTATLPSYMKPVRAKAQKSIKYIGEVTIEMNQACINKNFEKVNDCLTKLKADSDIFAKNYL